MKSRPSVFSALILFVTIAWAAHPTVTNAARTPLPTRDPLWTFTAKRGAFVSSPCLSPDGLTLYIGSGNGNLYALSTEEFGEGVTEKWAVKLPGAVYSSPIVDTNGLIYVGCTDGRVYAISDQGDFGRIEFHGRTAGKIVSSPALAEDGTVLVGASDNHLYSFIPDGGSPMARKWIFSSSNNVSTPVVTDSGSILVMSGGYLRKVSENGAGEAAFTPRSAIHSLPALGEDGTIYFGANDERVYAMDSDATTVQRRFNTGENVQSSPAVGADGRIYIASDNNRLYCLTTNLAILWSARTRGPIRSALSIGVDGSIYAGADDKRLYAFSSEGELLWTVKTRAPVRSSPALDAFGVVYFGSGNTVYAVETEAMADDADEIPWQMFRKNAQHTARATECRPFLIEEPNFLGGTEYTVTNGESVSISFNVRAGAALTVVWRFNGVEIDSFDNPSATNRTLVIAAPTALDVGEFTVHAVNDCGEVESDVFTLDVNAPPLITLQPTNQLLLASNSFTLRVAAVGSRPITYQWKRNGVDIAGATNASFTVTNAQPGDSGIYSVMVMNRFGPSTSSNATVTVFDYPLTFADHPLGAGHRHSLAVLTNRTLWTWGLNNFGQLGNGSSGGAVTNFNSRNVPQLVGTNGTVSTNAVWSSVSGGSRGFNVNSNTPGGFSIGIQTNGSLWAWGENDRGQLGNGNTTQQTIPARIGSDTNWIQAEAGATHVVALKRDGSLWTWGANDAGQLGLGTISTNSTSPVRVGVDSAWVEVRAGGFFSMARRADGTIWAWGTNAFGQLGIGSNRVQRAPVQVGSDSDWAAISIGVHHSLGLKSNGTLYAWGRNNFGQLGLGEGLANGNDTSNHDTPRQIGTAMDWAQIEAGSFHSFAIKSNGMIFAWGANFYGQLGDGTIGTPGATNDMNRISPVAIAADQTWRSVDASEHSLGMTTDGRVWAWGLNNFGQVGDGTGGDGTLANNRGTPVLLAFNAITNTTTVSNPPAITSQPSSQTVPQNGTATFSVGASGTGPLAYQWFFNSVAISSASNSSATNLSLLISNAQSENVGSYFAVVTNQFGRATSIVATLVVTNSGGQPLGPTNPPVFTLQPADMVAGEGSTVSFSVMATGGPPIAYQWYFSTNLLAAQTNATLVLTNIQGPRDAGFYSAVATNPFGSVTSLSAGLTITNTNGVVYFPGSTNGTETSNSPPVITQQPTNRTVRTNAPTSFTVAAIGAAPLFYAWRLNSNFIDSVSNTNATNATLIITNVGPTAGTNFYDVVVNNSFGSVTSLVRQLVVTNGSSGPPLPGGDVRPKLISEVRLLTITRGAEGVSIELSGAAGHKTAVLEFKESLSDAEWKKLSTHDASDLKLLDPSAPADRSRYYRVRLE